MLRRLYIKNLALIEECELTLNKGLNIITGETGAGKSLVLGSLSLLLGNKADKSVIRNGCNDAYIEAVFDITDRQIEEINSKDILYLSEDELIISRKITKDRNICRINGETVTNKILSSIGSIIIDVCGQRDNLILLNKESHLKMLDSYAYEEIKNDLSEVNKAYARYKELYIKLSGFKMDDSERAKKLDYLEFVFNEIESANLTEGEDEELENKFKKMDNSLKINENLSFIHQKLSEQDFSELIRAVKNIKDFDVELEAIHSQAVDIEAMLSDFNMSISSYIDEMDFSDEEFNIISERLNLINSLKTKYGKTVKEILDFQKEVEEQISELNNYQILLDKVNADISKEEKILNEKCNALSDKRKIFSKKFCEEIQKILLTLEFNYVNIKAEFSEIDGYSETGFDKMGFLISLNKGEVAKPLEEVVSGGELSRIMLAIKSLLADKSDDKVLIFDEIDTGIGGKTALSIAKLLGSLSGNRQIICITHLASIAASATFNYRIYKKETDDNRTNTFIEQLTGEDEIIKELARMISGDESEASLNNAIELRKNLKVK